MVVIDAAVAAFLEGPSAHTVATADVHGDPTVGRAWGLRVDRDGFVRALVGADTATVANLQAGGRIAVLVIDVGTYRSLQVKGTVTAVEPPTPADQEVYDIYGREFLAALTAEGRTTPLDEALPASVVAVTIDVDAVFDQTPGPGAGRSLASTS